MENPWIFDTSGKALDFSEKPSVMIKHAEYLVESKGTLVGCREIRKHLLSYVKGFQGAKSFRSQLSHVDSLDIIYDILSQIEVAVTETKKHYLQHKQ